MENKHYPFGSKLGECHISDVFMQAFSNGSCNNVADKHRYDDEGEYLGLEYQCVEFVRRYLYKKSGVNLAKRWAEGDAHDWYDNASTMGLSKVSLDFAKAGDVITFTGGSWGHVGIISEVKNDHLKISAQNFLNSPEDIDMTVLRSTLEGQRSIEDMLKNKYKFQSLLRLN